MFTTNLPEQFDHVLRDTEVPASVHNQNAERIKNGVHYDTAEADCIGWGEESGDRKDVYRGLHKGQNDHYFRHRVDRKHDLRTSLGGWGFGGVCFGGVSWLLITLLVLVPMAMTGSLSTRFLEALIAHGFVYSMIGGGLMGLLFHRARLRFYQLVGWTEPTTVQDRWIEPLSCAELLTDARSTPEQKLAEQIRDQQPTWNGPSGFVTELPDGTYLYEHNGEAVACEDDDELRDVIEEQNEPALYRRVFDDYQPA